MARLLQILAGLAVTAGATAGANAGPARFGGADDDNKQTVEVRLLKILKDRGVIKESEYDELIRVGAQMRAEDTITSAAIERELAELSEKVSLQSEAKRTAPDTKISYKHGSGLTVSQGDDFSMTIGGREQVRFSYISADGNTSAGQDDRASFDIRRARLYLKGNAIEKQLTYYLQIDFATDSGKLLRDAWLNYEFDRALQLRAGQMKRPFSRQNWTSAGDLQIVDRSSTVERFRSVAGDRDVGVLAWGTFEDDNMFEWYAGLYNGDGLNNGTPNAVNLGPASSGLNVANSSNNDSSGLEAVARLAFNPMGQVTYTESDLDLTETPKLGLAVQYDFNPEHRGNPLGLLGIPAGHLPSYDVHTFGGEIAFKYQGLFLTAELYHREISPTDRLDDLPGFHTVTEDGWFAQGGYFAGTEKGKGPEFALRYSQIDFDQDIFPASAAGGSTKIDDFTAAFNYFWAGHALKLQLAYTYRINRLHGMAADDEHQILQIQAQLKF